MKTYTAENRHHIAVKEIQFPNYVLLPEVIKLLHEGHSATIKLRGFSMRPFLEDNRDKALLKLPQTVKVGDPVLAEIAEGKYVLHRIVAIDGDAITLLGDGNLTPEHCSIADIRAAVEGFYRKGKSKLDRTDGWKWRIYSFLWMHLRPIRRYLLAAYRRIWIPLFGII